MLLQVPTLHYLKLEGIHPVGPVGWLHLCHCCITVLLADSVMFLTTTRILWPSHRSAYISWHPQLLRTGGFCCSKFHCPLVLAGSNQRILIRKKMLEFSSVVLPALSPYLQSVSSLSYTHTHTHSFSGPLSRTTRLSRYKKGTTNLVMLGIAVASAGPCASLHLAPDR